MGNPYPVCENCIFVDEPLDKDPCQECIRAFLAQRIKPNFISNRKPKTNADRIRAMTDEELAGKLEEIQLKTVKAYGNDDLLLKGELKKYWLDWLRQEAVSDG